jgi:hypothetical protein
MSYTNTPFLPQETYSLGGGEGHSPSNHKIIIEENSKMAARGRKQKASLL